MSFTNTFPKPVPGTIRVRAEPALEYLRSHIDHKGIYRVPPDMKKMLGKAPGSFYTWQFYLRRCIYDPTFLTLAAKELVRNFTSTDVQFAGVEDAGVALAAALGIETNTQWVTIKKQRKAYGLHNWLEGPVSGKPIVLVDDLAGSQNSLRVAAQTCRRLDLPLASYYVTLVNKTQHTHKENYIRQFRLVSLFSCEDFALSWDHYCIAYGQQPDFGPVY